MNIPGTSTIFKVTASMNTEYYYISQLIGLKRYDVINEKCPNINTATGTSDLKGSSKNGLQWDICPFKL